MNNEELTKFSGEHLLHELTMFWWLSGAIRYMDGYMHDSLLESWVVHLRNLICFFCRRERNTDNVLAENFFDTPGEWSQNESSTLKTARERANKELSHITGSRKYTEKDRKWDVGGLFQEIRQIAAKFAANASETKLHSDVRQLLKSARSEVLLVLGEQSQSTHSERRRGPSLASLDDWICGKDTRP